jgi:PST family polysaccharide transporter
MSLLPRDTSDRRPGPGAFGDALKWAYALTWGQRGLALVLTFVLAALLGPRDFGTVAMAAAYVVLVEMIVAQGMGAAIIQRRRLPRRHLDSIFWLLLVLAVALAGASALASPAWARLNRLPELALVITVLSTTIPLKALAIVPHALLQRGMDFRTIAWVTAGAVVAGGATGITLALAGAGVWALVAQQIVSSAVTAVGMMRAVTWRPRLRFRAGEVRPVLGFSGGVLASKLGVYTAEQADALLMGVLFGPLAVGLYRIADRLMTTLLEIGTRSIQMVALPHFSSLQDEPERLRAAVVGCLHLSATITIPAMAILGITGEPLLAIIGPEWIAAAPVLSIVVVIGMTKAVTLFSGPLLLATNRPRVVAVHIWIVGGLIVAALLAVGLPLRSAPVSEQIIGVAAAKTAVVVIAFGAVRMIITMRLCGITCAALARAVRTGVVAGLVAVVVGRLGTMGPGASEAPLVQLLWQGAACSAAALLVVLALEPEARRLLRLQARPRPGVTVE